MTQNITADYLSSLVPTPVSNESRYSLRNADNLKIHVPHARTTLFANSFLPSTVREWNLLPFDLRNTDSLSSFKCSLNSNSSTVVPAYYYVGTRKSQVLHTRLRTDCSQLNLSLFQKNIVDSPLCHCGEVESVCHYLLTCTSYQHHRTHLINEIAPIRTPTAKLLLNGDPSLDYQDNRTIFEAVQNYIVQTKRFS